MLPARHALTHGASILIPFCCSATVLVLCRRQGPHLRGGARCSGFLPGGHGWSWEPQPGGPGRPAPCSEHPCAARCPPAHQWTLFPFPRLTCQGSARRPSLGMPMNPGEGEQPAGKHLCTLRQCCSLWLAVPTMNSPQVHAPQLHASAQQPAAVLPLLAVLAMNVKQLHASAHQPTNPSSVKACCSGLLQHCKQQAAFA